MRVLVVVRHAKAEAYGPSDYERTLTARGRAEAAAAGGWLAERGIVPDQAIVSTAVRTRQTWEAMAERAGWTLTPWFDSGLYEADAETALDLVRALDDEVSTVVLVGHNPTVAYLAQMLDVTGAARIAETGFPTSAAAVFEYDGPWADLGEGTAHLAAVEVPGR